jgi:hypothetical protein
MVKNLSYVSAKLQTSLTDAIFVNSQTDWQAFSEFSLEPNQVMDSVKILSGKYSQEKLVKGANNISVKGKVPFCSSGTSTPPPAGIILKCGGFAETITAVGSAGNKYIYTRSIDSSAMSALYINRSTITSGSESSIVKAAHNIMFNSLKLPLDSCKIPILEFSGLGNSGGKESGGTALPYRSIQTLTAPTGSGSNTYTVNDVENTMLTTSWEFVKATIELSTKLQQIPIMRDEGYRNCEITDQEDKFTAQILADTTSDDALVTLQDGETGVFSIVYGQQTGMRVSITCTTCQLSSAKDSTNGDLLSSDLGGNFLVPLVITFNSDLVA